MIHFMRENPSGNGRSAKNGPEPAEEYHKRSAFSYSGYLKVSNKNLAIINGVEYEAGDPLEIEGYVLKKIYPGKVVIVNEKSGAKFDVPLQE